ncbi:hypothetical protein RHGRI_009154 [Rhododendron griersonianum]|uniref:Uncharacterized protein n=1 Tax=Rhododendron griersonianum TaxID=479676 RepID=A0AAV6L509_9ERIC|nr:hypothetical protein RHGRI_009154 [Rhododendron griersonianum]
MFAKIHFESKTHLFAKTHFESQTHSESKTHLFAKTHFESQLAALAASSTTYHRILQTTSYSSSSSLFKSRFLWHHAIANRSSSHWTRSTAVNTVVGTMLFSVTTSTLAKEVYTKESSSKKFTPEIRGTTGPLQFEHTTSVARLQSRAVHVDHWFVRVGNWLVQDEIWDIGE